MVIRGVRHVPDVEGPDPIVLCDWEGAQCPVHHSPGARDFPLVDEEGAVVHPDARHLVHEDERALEGVVHLLEDRIRHAAASDLK